MSDHSPAAGLAGHTVRAAAPRRPFHPRPAAVVSHVVLAVLGCLFLFPAIWGALTSLKGPSAVYSLAPVAAPTLANYQGALRSYPYLRLLANTTAISLGVTALGLVAALPAAYALTRFRFAGRGVVLALLLGSLLVPAQVTLVPDYVIIARLHLLNTLAGVILPEAAGVAVAVVVLRASLLDFPVDLYEAAAMDGAGPLATLVRVVLPNLGAAVAAAAILLLVSSWNDYFWPLLVTNQLDTTTLQVGLQIFQSDSATAWGPLLAMNTLALVPVALLFLIAQRWIADAYVRSGVR